MWCAGLFILGPVFVLAQEQAIPEMFRLKVLDITQEGERPIIGTDAKAFFQNIRGEVLSGEKKGDTIELENDRMRLRVGDTIFVRALEAPTGETFYTVDDVDRRNSLFFFVGLFMLLVIVFGGKQGIRALMSLAGSFFVIFYFLLPSILSGVSPLLVSAGVSIVILVIAIYFTHGLTRTSTAALLGTIVTICVTVLLALISVRATRLSGFTDDTSVFLNFNTAGALDFQGLLLGAIIIGVLGLLDDIAITQAAAVKEIFHVDASLSRKDVYARALRIGKEHVGALVNTLALAYTGAALPLLLLFYGSEASVFLIINREIFASEIIRTMVGSIGIILAVPITTGLAVLFLVQKKRRDPEKGNICA